MWFYVHSNWSSILVQIKAWCLLKLELVAWWWAFKGQLCVHAHCQVPLRTILSFLCVPYAMWSLNSFDILEYHENFWLCVWIVKCQIPICSTLRNPCSLCVHCRVYNAKSQFDEVQVHYLKLHPRSLYIPHNFHYIFRMV